MNNTLSLKDAISRAWEAFVKHVGTFVTVTFVFLVLSMLIGSVDQKSEYGPLAGIIAIFISFFASYVSIRLALVTVRGGVPMWKDAVTIEWRWFGWYVFASLLSAVVYVVGFTLFIIPGFFLLTRLALFNFALIDEQLLPIGSMKRSWNLTQGHFWQMFVAGIIIVGLNIAGSQLFGIGILISSPLSFLFSAYIYEKLREASVPVISSKVI